MHSMINFVTKNVLLTKAISYLEHLTFIDNYIKCKVQNLL